MVVIHKKKVETQEEKDLRTVHEQERAAGIEDEYQAKGLELVWWARHHKIIVIALIVLVIAGGTAFAAYSYYQKRMAEQASASYLEIVRKFEDTAKSAPEDLEKYREAQKELAELAKKFKSTRVAVLAELWAGHLALQSNDAAGSVIFYQNALQKMKPHDELYPLVLIGLAYAEESNGQKNEALTRFVAVTELKDGPGKDLALWEAARLSKDVNNTEKAKEYVARLLEEYPSSMYEKNAKRLKESL